MPIQKCPGGCGNVLRGADIMCSTCINHVSKRTRSELFAAWRRFGHTFSPADMSAYVVIVARAISEARAAMGAENARLIEDTDAL